MEAVDKDPNIMQELTEPRVLEILRGYGNDPQQLIAALLDIQEASGRNYVDRRWAQLSSRSLNVPLTLVYEVLSFYSMFSTKPRGRHVIELCKSAPCHFQLADRALGWFEEALGIKCGGTTENGLFTLERTSCIGLCDRAPAVRVGDESFGDLTKEKVIALLTSYRVSDPRIREGL
jgi:NADH-quinone oxidoreductase subunit E